MQGPCVKKIATAVTVATLWQVAHPVTLMASPQDYHDAMHYVDPISCMPLVGKGGQNLVYDWKDLFRQLKQGLSGVREVLEAVPPDGVLLVDVAGGVVPVVFSGQQDVDTKKLSAVLSLVLLGTLSFGTIVSWGLPGLTLPKANGPYAGQINNRSEASSTCANTAAAMLINALSPREARLVTPDELYDRYGGKKKAQSPDGRAEMARDYLKDTATVESGSFPIDRFNKLLERGIAAAGGNTTSKGHIVLVLARYEFTETQVKMIKRGDSFADVLNKGPALSEPDEEVYGFYHTHDPWGNWEGAEFRFGVPNNGANSIDEDNILGFEYDLNIELKNSNDPAKTEKGRDNLISQKNFEARFIRNGGVGAAIAIPKNPDRTRVFDIYLSQTNTQTNTQTEPTDSRAVGVSQNTNMFSTGREQQPQMPNQNGSKSFGLAFIATPSKNGSPLVTNPPSAQPETIPEGSVVIFKDTTDDSWLHVLGVLPASGWEAKDLPGQGPLWLPSPSSNPFLECSPWKVCRTLRDTPVYQNGALLQSLPANTLVRVDDYESSNGGWITLKAVGFANKIQPKQGFVARADTSVKRDGAQPNRAPSGQQMAPWGQQQQTTPDYASPFPNQGNQDNAAPQAVPTTPPPSSPSGYPFSGEYPAVEPSSGGPQNVPAPGAEQTGIGGFFSDIMSDNVEAIFKGVSSWVLERLEDLLDMIDEQNPPPAPQAFPQQVPGAQAPPQGNRQVSPGYEPWQGGPSPLPQPGVSQGQSAQPPLGAPSPFGQTPTIPNDLPSVFENESGSPGVSDPSGAAGAAPWVGGNQPPLDSQGAERPEPSPRPQPSSPPAAPNPPRNEPQRGANAPTSSRRTPRPPPGSGLVDIRDVAPNVLLDMRYATKNNFLGQDVYGADVCWLRPKAAQALKRAQEIAEQRGYKLKVFDCYRPTPVQQKMWDIVKGTDKEPYVAAPGKSKHNKGVAVDITLVDARTGEELDMPSAFDDFTSKAGEVNANSLLLRDIMTKAGFEFLNLEWWHYDHPGDGSESALDQDFLTTP